MLNSSTPCANAYQVLSTASCILLIVLDTSPKPQLALTRALALTRILGKLFSFINQPQVMQG
jgi:hypothetical protein